MKSEGIAPLRAVPSLYACVPAENSWTIALESKYTFSIPLSANGYGMALGEICGCFGSMLYCFRYSPGVHRQYFVKARLKFCVAS